MSKRVLPILPSFYAEGRIEAGCDEAGRGCIAGPVVAAAVILSPDRPIEGLFDSKQLTARRREELVIEIKEKASAWAIASATAQEIDEINILHASCLAMTRAVEQLTLCPDHLLIDGNRWYSTLRLPYTCIVGGDAKVGSIAAASILAKCTRDEIMHTLAIDYPEYDWQHNVGYPTPKHVAAIRSVGITPHHRRSFGPCQPTLFDL